MKLQAIKLFGIVTGRIWMPAIEAEKPFDEVFAPAALRNPFQNDWTGIRDALLKITNDGDFQSCEISELYGYAEYIETDGHRKGCRVTVPMTFNPKAEEYSDLLTPDCLLG